EGFRIPRRCVKRDQLKGELERLRTALQASAQDARGNQQAVNAKLGQQYGAIFGAHALLIEDPSLSRELETLIRDQCFTAEYAVSRVMRRHAKTLESMDSGQLATRAVDLFDIEKSILRQLLGQRREQLTDLQEA